MKFQCKFCRKRMEPRIELEDRIVTSNQETYFCSLCGKQLMVIGGFLDKPFWKQPRYIWLWMPSIFLEAIDIWEKFKNSLKEQNIIKFIFILALLISFLFTLMSFDSKNFLDFIF